MTFRSLCAAACLAWAAAAQAQPAAGIAELIERSYREAFVPRAAAFAEASGQLSSAVGALCEAPADGAAAALEAARAQWRNTTAAWDRLAGIAVGPVVKRRALTALDFNPTRPATIERAIKTAPSTPEQMERIGTPAKGIPALEWLLWSASPAPAPQSPTCRYTQQVAQDLQREAAAIAEGFGTLAATDWKADPERTNLALQELINQWLGGVERLRWTQIEKPLKAAETSSGGKAPAFTRMASGHTAQSWAAQGEALSELAPPVADALRARGHGPLADRLAQSVTQAEPAMRAATPADAAGLGAAVRELGALKKLIEAEVAPALDVTIGFSDGDGD